MTDSPRRRDPMERQRAKDNEPRQGEPGYTPNEFDFCACGTGTFQRARGYRNRVCSGCGAEETERQSFHERTGLPYTTGPLPAFQDGDEAPEAPAAT